MASTFVMDDSSWPLCLMVAEGHQHLALHSKMLSAWDCCFARKERFVVLRVYLDCEALDHAPGIAKATKEWLKSGAQAQIRDWVSAMAIVVPPARYEKMKKMNVQAVFQVPGSIFQSSGDALDWLKAENFLDEGANLPAGLCSQEK